MLLPGFCFWFFVLNVRFCFRLNIEVPRSGHDLGDVIRTFFCIFKFKFLNKVYCQLLLICDFLMFSIAACLMWFLLWLLSKFLSSF
jgi:hypothetical protein